VDVIHLEMTIDDGLTKGVAVPGGHRLPRADVPRLVRLSGT
jgi:hypothetical protein